MAIAPRIGTWEVSGDGEVTLLGSHCTTCGEHLFPARTLCSNCGQATLEDARLRGPATLAGYTVVYQAPAGFASPYAVGYGKLNDDVMVLAPIDADPASLRRGLVLELHEGVTSMSADGEPFRTYRFRPAAG